MIKYTSIFSFDLLVSSNCHLINASTSAALFARRNLYGTWRRLKAVHFNDKSHGARVLGYVTKGHREISLCALPPRISLARFLDRCQSPKKFGAKRGSQWPEIAIRKYLLYDVFLHELGHLQIVDEKAKDARHKFANETLAQSFADHWRMILWRDHYSHEDAVHNAPYKLQPKP